MANVQVRCSVNNCHYWAQNNYCSANQILVTSDSVSNRYGDNFDAPSLQNTLSTPVQMGMETCCKTFVPKNSGTHNMDNVKRQ
ncbi:DUF1540 domain-containing protein [Calorimonas adulescens]|jgi:Domain of Unknown Function (DUF1540).|uniref:DUF1540 domain-containing protein n=1 Tax=Calorimonas adulescens TaxID=2606906 RepID=A0A5D8QHD9_9THEO|nr:DUF1540 domain-containing protein [Calorimonas adulescens]TZE83614.1 DUF1540 domain-containing protein [Calorimonas adulescens]